MPDSAFDAWYNEIEGFALRAERLTGPKAELMAAFEAGVEASGKVEITDDMAKRFLETRPFGDATISKYLGLETNFHSIAIAKRVISKALSTSLKEQEEGN